MDSSIYSIELFLYTRLLEASKKVSCRG